jgi:cysteine sulfinate desulfinase/cysteine desulfurase-like protein
MSDYLIRVEMHGATYADYERLHALLAAKNVTNFILSDQQVRYRLPTAMYTYTGTETAEQVRTAVAQIAASVRANPAVVVTVRGVTTWQGLQAA